tara:strand:+ start:126 stop:707 length:582 start_codon:yes stop_codon:yes gene_type:complete
MVNVYDNFASPEYFEQLQHVIAGPFQTWYYQDNIVGNFWGKDQLGKHGLNCWVVEQPNVFTDSYTSGLLTNLLLQMKTVINRENVLRSRLDMTFYTPNDTECYPHIDDIVPHIATIFYFNDSDGNTVIYNEKYDSEDGIYSSKVIKEKKIELTVQKEIEPKANRLITFDGSFIHTGNVPCKHNNRIILNSNFN